MRAHAHPRLPARWQRRDLTLPTLLTRQGRPSPADRFFSECKTRPIPARQRRRALPLPAARGKIFRCPSKPTSKPPSPVGAAVLGRPLLFGTQNQTNAGPPGTAGPTSDARTRPFQTNIRIAFPGRVGRPRPTASFRNAKPDRSRPAWDGGPYLCDPHAEKSSAALPNLRPNPLPRQGRPSSADRISVGLRHPGLRRIGLPLPGPVGRGRHKAGTHGVQADVTKFQLVFSR